MAGRAKPKPTLTRAVFHDGVILMPGDDPPTLSGGQKLNPTATARWDAEQARRVATLEVRPGKSTPPPRQTMARPAPPSTDSAGEESGEVTEENPDTDSSE